jgi:ferredoxin-NADP reductase
MQTPRHATVTEISEIAPNVLQLTLAIHDLAFRFDPGQYINVRFPEGVSRAYTIASAPERPEAVQLCVRLGSGRGALALRSLQAGTDMTIEGPFGDFVLPHDDREVIFLAGDTGIAPVRSIVLHMLAGGDPRPITVLYEPDEKDILYAGDFDPLARDGKIRHESGRIAVLIERNRKALQRSRLMIAGFDPFLAQVQECFEKHGLHFDDAIVETFGPLP